jgi:hypothetical protein
MCSLEEYVMRWSNIRYVKRPEHSLGAFEITADLISLFRTLGARMHVFIPTVKHADLADCFPTSDGSL